MRRIGSALPRGGDVLRPLAPDRVQAMAAV